MGRPRKNRDNLVGRAGRQVETLRVDNELRNINSWWEVHDLSDFALPLFEPWS
jgi:hypothetical protein